MFLGTVAMVVVRWEGGGEESVEREVVSVVVVMVVTGTGQADRHFFSAVLLDEDTAHS